MLILTRASYDPRMTQQTSWMDQKVPEGTRTMGGHQPAMVEGLSHCFIVGKRVGSLGTPLDVCECVCVCIG